MKFPKKSKKVDSLPPKVEEQRDQMLMFDLKHKPAARPPKVNDDCLRAVSEPEMQRYYEKGLYNSKWYTHTYATIRELFGSDSRANLFILILASTSPMASVHTNTLMALKALKMYDDGASPSLYKKEFMKTHWLNIFRVFNGEPIHGPKVSAFAANLYGDTEAVTVDRWMLRVYSDEEDERMNLSTYRCIASDIRRRAHAEKGLVYPPEYQAALWTGIKLLKGDVRDTADPFDVLLRAKLQGGQMKLAFEEHDPDIPGSFAAFEAALGPLPSEPEYPEEEIRDMSENPPASDTVFVYDPRKVALK